jgi:hypothetical protein
MPAPAALAAVPATPPPSLNPAPAPSTVDWPNNLRQPHHESAQNSVMGVRDVTDLKTSMRTLFAALGQQREVVRVSCHVNTQDGSIHIRAYGDEHLPAALPQEQHPGVYGPAPFPTEVMQDYIIPILPLAVPRDPREGGRLAHPLFAQLRDLSMLDEQDASREELGVHTKSGFFAFVHALCGTAFQIEEASRIRMQAKFQSRLQG